MRALRKITPTAPQGSAAAIPAAMHLPPAYNLLLRMGRDEIRIRLQQAFLAQYSTDAHPVSRCARRKTGFHLLKSIRYWG